MWIDEFRERNGIERHEFARRVRVIGAHRRPHRPIGCSEELVWLLERAKVPRTHPRIADLIAEACGATPEERDMIVDERHRGTWRGDGVPRALFVGGAYRIGEPAAAPADALARENPWRTYPAVAPRKKTSNKRVVKVDRNGEVLERYDSLTSASAYNGISVDSISLRCSHKVPGEFEKYDYTFRLASDWDGLSAYARKADLLRTRMSKGVFKRRGKL